MLIQCKLLSQETFTIEADPSSTIGDLKLKIEELKGASYKADSLKLIYAGKVWDKNDATLESENYKEPGFIVVMSAKPKAPPKPVETSTKTSGDSTNAATAQPAAAPVAPTSNIPSQPVPPAQPAPGAPSVAAISGAFGVSPQEYQAMVDNISQMGYPKEEVERALRASFFNPERAVEYLISGLPPGAGGVPMPPVFAQGSQPAIPRQPAQPVAVPAAAADPLAFFRDSPQFAQMRQMIQQDPTLLEQFMTDIGQSNPELLQRIRDHQEDFLQILNAESEGEEGEMDDFPVGMGELQAPPGVHFVNVSAEENAAIERLKGLGFPEQMVIEAFFACDKNEELAANLLLSNLDEANQG